MTARLEREQSVDGQGMTEMNANIMDGLHGMIAWDGWAFRVRKTWGAPAALVSLGRLEFASCWISAYTLGVLDNTIF